MTRKDLEAWALRALIAAVAAGLWQTFWDVQMLKRDWQWMHGDSHAPSQENKR